MACALSKSHEQIRSTLTRWEISRNSAASRQRSFVSWCKIKVRDRVVAIARSPRRLLPTNKNAPLLQRGVLKFYAKGAGLIRPTALITDISASLLDRPLQHFPRYPPA